MQIGTSFSVSVHMLLCVEFFKNTNKITSAFVASSVHTNPVIIRKLMVALKDAGIIKTTAGTGGIELTRKASKISLLDVYKAVDPVKNGMLFKVHPDSAQNCPVGSKIDTLLSGLFTDVQNSMEKKLASYSLQSVLDKLKE